MLSTIAWVPRGFAREVPLKYNPDAAMDEEAAEDAGGTAGGSDGMEMEASASGGMMAGYEQEDDGIAGMQMFGKLADPKLGLMYHKTNEEDPYMEAREQDQDEDLADDELDAINIRPTDMLVLSTRCEEDYYNMEIYVYEEEEEDEDDDEDSQETRGNIFVHHDIMLPDFALASAWTGTDPTEAVAKRGNFVAVATAAPMIEIWDLDVLNAMEPTLTLGGARVKSADSTDTEMDDEMAGSSKKERARNKSKKAKAKKKKGSSMQEDQPMVTSLDDVDFEPGSHRDSVMGLSWNQTRHHLLASCSADQTVKVWDCADESASCLHTFSHHKSKVQSVAWSPTEPAILLSASFDRTAAVIDVRASNTVATWAIPDDAEAAGWNPSAPHTFCVATSDGQISCYDARAAGSGPLTSVKAHQRECTTMVFNPAVPNMIATGGTDKTVKIWELDVAKGVLECIHVNDGLNAGAVFAVDWCPDEPFYLAVAGAKGKVRLWDSLSALAVRRRFEGLAPALAARKGRRLPTTVAGMD